MVTLGGLHLEKDHWLSKGKHSVTCPALAAFAKLSVPLSSGTSTEQLGVGQGGHCSYQQY